MMHEPVDPAHLYALHVLLEEAHVTRAARRLGITQSSMSHRLAKLREALGDPLFVRRGAQLLPTARALAMREPLAAALGALAAAVSPPGAFEPKTSRFKLRLYLPDLLAPALPRVMRALGTEAPTIALEVLAVPADLSGALSGSEPSLAFAPTHFVRADIVVKALGELRFVVLGRKGHPALSHRLTVTRWLSYPHMVVSVGNETANPIEQSLRRLALTRRVGLSAPSFLAALHALAHSDMLMNAPMPLVADVKRSLGLALREAPIDLPSVRFAMAFHPRFQHDSAHRWVRERLHASVQSLFVPAAAASVR